MITENQRREFTGLGIAMLTGDACLIEVTEKSTGKKVVLCAVAIPDDLDDESANEVRWADRFTRAREDEKRGAEIYPIAIMIEGDPFELYEPPVGVDAIETKPNGADGTPTDHIHHPIKDRFEPQPWR